MRYFKIRKIIASLLIATAVLAINPIRANAEWRQDSVGWWYADGNSWYTGWKLINGKWYYFDSNGYMAHDRYINGFSLNSEGYWDLNELPSNVSSTLQGVSVKYPSSWGKKIIGKVVYYYLDNRGTNVTAMSSDMQGLSNKDFLEENIEGLKKTFSIDQVNTSTQNINDIKMDILDYEYKSGSNLHVKLHQAVFYNNNKAYTFTLTMGSDIPSEDIMASFNDMLKTVKYVN